MTVDWSALMVIAADLPPRSDAPARLAPIMRDQAGALYRVRVTEHGEVLEQLDEDAYQADYDAGDVAPLISPLPARAGYWLIRLGAIGWKYCAPEEAVAEFDAFARHSVERAETALKGDRLEDAFTALDNAVLARPDDPVARAALIAVARRLRRDDAWLYEQWLDSAHSLGTAWARQARRTYPGLMALIADDRQLERHLAIRPSWASERNGARPSSYFERASSSQSNSVIGSM